MLVLHLHVVLGEEDSAAAQKIVGCDVFHHCICRSSTSIASPPSSPSYESPWWTISSGGQWCKISQAGRCVTYRGSFGTGETCTIDANLELYVTASEFHAEACCDTFAIGGRRYTGTGGPVGVHLQAFSTMSWDGYGMGTDRGWTVCASSRPPPTLSPPTSPSPGISGGDAAVQVIIAQMQVLCSSMGPTSIGPMLDGYVASIVGAAPPGAPPLTGTELARYICSPGLDSSVFTGAFSPTIVPTLCSADCHAYMQFTLSVSTLSVSNPTDGPPPDFFPCLCDVPATAAFMNRAPSTTTLMRLQPELCASPACVTMMAAAPEGTFPFSCPSPPPLPPPPSPSPPKLPSPPELPSPPDLVDTRNAQTAAAPGGVPLLPLLAAGGGGIAVLGLLVGVLLGFAIHRHRARTAFRQFREDSNAPLPATMPTLVSGQQANPLQAGVVIESPLQVEMVSPNLKDVAQATDSGGVSEANAAGEAV